MQKVQADQNKWRGRFLRYAPLFLWIGVIFTLSSGAGAMSETSRFIGPLLAWLFPDASAESLVYYHGVIRKGAHLAEYAVLAFLAWRAFRSSSIPTVAAHSLISALLVVLAVAAADEFNQSFLPARTGSVGDIAIDAAGGIAMLAAIRLFSVRRGGALDD